MLMFERQNDKESRRPALFYRSLVVKVLHYAFKFVIFVAVD